jgi:hypothetical protein
MQTPAEILTETARLFAVAAETRYTTNGCTVETQGNVSVLHASPMPHNRAKVTSFSVVWREEAVEVRVYSNTVAGDDYETSGFVQTSHRKTLSVDGLTAEALAAEIVAMGKPTVAAPVVLAA